MEIKLFEIRDRMTFIPAMAIRLHARTEMEFWLLRRAGYGADHIAGSLEKILEPYIILIHLGDNKACNDPYDWPNLRTMGNIHKHLIEEWKHLESGQLLDVEFILGETRVPKKSEMFGETNIVRNLEERDRFIP